jgi:hypothetical protein
MYYRYMVDHQFPGSETRCVVCGVHKKDAHRVSCNKRVLDFPIPGEKSPPRADRKPRK